MNAASPLRKRESHIFEREAEDFYTEPAWPWQRFFATPGFIKGMTVLDPACGLGTAVEAACAAGMHGLGSDIVPRWEQAPAGSAGPRTFISPIYLVADFLDGEWPARRTPGWQFPDVIASNPPFKHAKYFAELALERAVTSVCLILPTKWMQGDKRARWLATTPLHKVWCICPRPSMPPGHVIIAGGKPGNGTVDYSIFQWLRGYSGPPQIGWLHRDGET